jgi:hypothetical protein
MRFLSYSATLSAMLLVGACAAGNNSGTDAGGIDATVADAGADANSSDDGAVDAADDAQTRDGGLDLGSDAGPNCLELGHAAGERYPLGDDCNFCDCAADGNATCTTRTCAPVGMSCEYAGTLHAYGETFAASDGCNECACAASGLACTRRDCAPEIVESAILLESSSEPCGFEDFTINTVLSALPYTEFTTTFPYIRDREFYPEVNPDSTITVRISYDGGVAACRIPMPGQEAIDLEVRVEFITADGKFNEGLHAYLRRDRTSMVDWFNMVASVPTSGLSGFYGPACFDANGYVFHVNIFGDGHAEGAISKTCETDIYLDIGAFEYTPAP